MIFLCSKLSFYIENDIEISQLKNLLIKQTFKVLGNTGVLEGKKALFLMNPNQDCTVCSFTPVKK